MDIWKKGEWREPTADELRLGAVRVRDYETDDGNYRLMDYGDYRPRYEMFAPTGRNFGVNHSFVEARIKDAEEHISEPLDSCADAENCCSCDLCGCDYCREYDAEVDGFIDLSEEICCGVAMLPIASGVYCARCGDSILAN